MEVLSIDNILSTEDINDLFSEEVQESQTEQIEDTTSKKNEIDTTEVDVDNLFTDIPESVGSEEIEDLKGKEDISSKEDLASSQKNNFYSSIAKALKEDGVFLDLDDDTISKIENPEDFSNLIELQVTSKLEEKQKRIDEALNVGIEPTQIKKYETALNYLESINDSTLSNENAEGETLRKQLIYQDFINRGYSKERAEREVTKSFNAGTDIEDAKEALSGTKEFVSSQYNSIITQAKQAEENEAKERAKQANQLKKSILEEDKVFGDIIIDKNTRQKVFDSISKPIYKDPNTGEYYTAIQKYEMENKTDFLKNIGLLFTLTDGFKNLDKLVKGKVTKEVKKGLKELEHTINNTSRTSDGNLKFVNSGVEDTESYIGFNIDA